MVTMGRSPGARLAALAMGRKRGSSSKRAALSRKEAENEIMARNYLVDLARQVEEEMTWRVQLEHEVECRNLIQATEAFERTTRKEKADRMRFAFQLKDRVEVVELAGYENGVANKAGS